MSARLSRSSSTMASATEAASIQVGANSLSYEGVGFYAPST